MTKYKKEIESYLHENKQANDFIKRLGELFDEYKTMYFRETYDPEDLLDMLIGEFGVDLENLVNNFAEKTENEDYKIDISFK